MRWQRNRLRRVSHPTSADDDLRGTLGAGGGGSNDVTSGGGNGTGTPDGDTAMRAGAAVTRGDVKEDREKLFPETVDRAAAHSAEKVNPQGIDKR